jgi:N-acetylglucosaminyldiphosphoundecaprenol N-acetyl-beta-D-mannosaminyltransferase
MLMSAAEVLGTVPGPPDTVFLCGVPISRVTCREALERIESWVEDPGAVCRYVTTPNLDHLVLLRRSEAFRAAYRDASLVTADGWPVITLSRWAGKALPERVAGSDLCPMLCARAASAGRPLRWFLLGGKPGVGQRAADRLQQTWPGVQVVGLASPPIGFESDRLQNDRLIEQINTSGADLLLIGLGAPKQELWIHAHARRLQVPVALCGGASIDFLAGEQTRAPQWMREHKLEWVHRLATNPRRLFWRYLTDAWQFPQILWAERRGRTAVAQSRQ